MAAVTGASKGDNMGRVKNLTGLKFGRLTVLEQHGFTKKNKWGTRYAIWYCRCDCGNYCEMSSDVIQRKRNHSCGCLAKENLEKMRIKNITHGMTGTRLYYCYKGMLNRCYREKDIHYNAYGRRGITVCDEWRQNRSNFFKWALENGYDDSLTIDRIDVNGNYEPSNCRWIPMSEQYKNKQSNCKKQPLPEPWEGEEE